MILGGSILEEKIVPSSIHFAPQRWRLFSQLQNEIGENKLCMVSIVPPVVEAETDASPAARMTGSRIYLENVNKVVFKKYVYLIEVA